MNNKKIDKIKNLQNQLTIENGLNFSSPSIRDKVGDEKCDNFLKTLNQTQPTNKGYSKDKLSRLDEQFTNEFILKTT